MSPLSRLIDWLSLKYSILFVISAGNHLIPIETNLARDEFESLSEEQMENVIVRALYEEKGHRKLLSPAESINGLTVGALHHDNSTNYEIGNRLDIFKNQLPSPASAFGSGYRRAIKPDFVFPGGKLLYRGPFIPSSNIKLDPVPSINSPGHKVATPGVAAGDTNLTQYCCGTSNSAALISRAAAICYDSLTQIFEDQAPDIEYNNYASPLLKAMLIHGCSWGEVGDRLNILLQTSENRNQLKSWISQWLGYGVPDISRVLDCTGQRASLLGFGFLRDGEANVFRLPLPPSLGAQLEWRRLTVTLAWLSPIASNTQKYRTASLWFKVGNDTLSVNRFDVDWQAARRGTVQHEVFEGERAIAISEGDTLEIKVNCRKDAGKIENPIAYGLAVSLEVAEGVDIAIYDEIRARIAQAVQVRPGERV